MKNINWPVIGSVAAFLAGVVGSILTPVLGPTPATVTSDILQALSGVAAIIGGGAATYVAASAAKQRALFKAQREHDSLVALSGKGLNG
jgi:hypothetical protein